MLCEYINKLIEEVKAKFIKDLMEDYDELVVSMDQTPEDLINLVHSADKMLGMGIEPLLHTKKEYKKAREKAMSILKTHYKLSREEIQDRLTEEELIFSLHEAFDVLTWSRNKLPKTIADQIEETHEGGYGEKLQTSLLKVINKDELMKWYNKNFEVGEIHETELAKQHPWNQIFELVTNLVQRDKISSEKELEFLIESLINDSKWHGSEPDDIKDAAWAAYTETI